MKDKKNKVILLFVIMLFSSGVNSIAQNLSGFKCKNDAIGDKLLAQYIWNHLQYPDDARFSNDTLGTILFTSFYINENGGLDSVVVLNDNKSAFHIQLMKDLKKMKIEDKWKSGVRRVVMVPIIYESPYFDEDSSALEVSITNMRNIKKCFIA